MARQLDPDPEIQAELISYIETELAHHFGERGDLEARWIREQNDFWAEASADSEELPVIGFASLIVPLTAIAVEAIHARDMGQMFGLKELVSIEVAPEHNNIRSDLDKLFNHQFLNEMDFRKVIESPLLQMTKHGTAIGMAGYKEVKTQYVKIQDDKEIKVPVYRKKGVCIEGIDISDFIMPFYAMDVADAPWVGHRFKVSEYTLKQMVASSLLAEDAYVKLNGHYQNITTESNIEQNIEEQTDTSPIFPMEIPLYRILLDYDVDGDGVFSSIEIVFHRESRQLLSICYHEDRDYEKGVYIPMEYRWFGYGVAKQNESFQEEVTAQHRQRLDNATIANMAMFKVKKSASWIKDDDRIFPGKKWYVENMDDIEPMFIGDVKASAYNNENQVVIYSQQRTGVNELTLGMPGVGTPGTASDSLARVQESNRKFDYTYNNKKDFANRLIYRASQHIIQYGAVQREVFEILPQGAEVEIFLRQKEKLTNKLFFNIQLAGAKNNKVLDRNTYTQLAGMQTQYWTQTMALAQNLQDPMLVQEMTKAALRAADMINLEILRAFDVPNPEKLIFNFDAYRPQPQPQLPVPNEVPGAPPAGAGGLGTTGGNEFNSIITPGVRVDNASITSQGGFSLPGLPLAG
jgi:hypothetical protein